MAVPNLGELASTTLQMYEKSLEDNIFRKAVVFNHLKANGGMKSVSGGRSIVIPLMYSTNSTVKAFTGLDTLDNTYQDTVDAAEVSWKNYDVSVVFTFTDELQNSGESQVIDLLEAKIMQAENSLRERLNDDLYNGAASDTKEITGLETIVAASGSYAGINGSTYSWWTSRVNATAATLTVAMMREAKNTANLGNGGSNVSIIVTSQTLYEKYAALLTATYSMSPSSSESKRLGDGGFAALEFEGVPVVFDQSCAADRMYFLNKDNFKLAYHPKANFKVMKKAEPTDQHVSISHIVWSGNTWVNRRASLAALDGKTV
jgi:hypothetical protein